MIDQRKWLILICVLLACGGGAGGFFLWQAHKAEIVRQAEEKKIQDARVAAAKEYEDLLNGFIKDIAQEIKVYKTQRTVLKEIVRPHNFEKPSDAKQNYEEYKNEILPLLKKQAGKVLGVFDVYGARLDQVLEEKPQETQEFLRKKWMDMREEQSKPYQDYFAQDASVLLAYEELLRFYFVKAKSYKVTEDVFAFQDPEDKKAEQELLAIIQDLQKPPTAEKEPVFAVSPPAVAPAHNHNTAP